METLGLKHLKIVKDIDECNCSDNTTRIKELVSVSAAFAVNCPLNLKKHITAARNVGISNDEIKSALKLTLFIKSKAASHVDRIAERIGSIASLEEKAEDMGGFGCGKNDAQEETTISNREAVVATGLVEGNDCGCGGDC